MRSHHTDADTYLHTHAHAHYTYAHGIKIKIDMKNFPLKSTNINHNKKTAKKHKLLSCLHTPTSPFRTFQPHHHPIYFPSTIPQFFSSLSLPKNPNFFQIPHLLHFHFHFSHVKTPLPSPPPTCFPSHVMFSPLHQPHFKYKIKTETYPHFTSHYLLLHHHLLQRKKYPGKENGNNLKRRRGAPRAPVYYLLIGLFSHPPR